MSSMGGGSRRGWSSGDDYFVLSLIVIVVGLGFLGWQLWTEHHAEVVAAVAWLQIRKMTFVAPYTADLVALREAVITGNYATVTFERLVAMCGQVNGVFRVPAALLIGALGVVCFVWAPPGRYRRRFDLDGLLREQAGFYRSAGAMLGRRLRLVLPAPAEPRPADPALHLDEWLQRFALDGRQEIDEGCLRRALVRQLGPAWRGPRRARPAVRVLFAAFALHLAGDREAARSLLGDFAVGLAASTGHGSAGPEKALPVPAEVLARADAILADATIRDPAEIAANFHGYETTAMMGLLNAARLASGVLAPAQFNGLKLVDRNLWYALHSLGFPGHGPGQNSHPNPRVEAVGARSHWQAERKARCPLFQPCLDEAVSAVRMGVRQHQAEAKRKEQG
ncbi:secretion/conjugation apparatus DotM-related subunit [Roseomonas mucosa]|uniref:secretion/conjugation apparatus DotM-related subunit n=1 Tax=Roseomonas mucosa TaxID=207340 RepID=UPI0038509C35